MFDQQHYNFKRINFKKKNKKTNVEAYPTFFLDNIVKAQPSTAMSCVAAKKFNGRKTHIKKKTLGGFSKRIKLKIIFKILKIK